MTARNYTVIGEAATVVQEFPLARDLFIVNEDTSDTVYLDTTRGITYTSGMPLPPQSTKRWEKGDPCFAICAPGQTANINVSDNAGELNNPAAVASQILTQGLATQIASAINLQGVPAIDQPTTLLSGTYTHTGGPVFNSPTLDTSKYQSIALSIRNNEPSASGGPAQRFTLVILFWYMNGMFVASDAFHVMGDNNNTGNIWAQAYARIPVRGNQCILQLTNGAATGNTTYSLTGSYRAVNAIDSYLGSGYWGISGIGQAQGLGFDGAVNYTFPATVANGSVWDEYPPVVGGQCTITLASNNAGPANGVDLQLFDQETSANYGGWHALVIAAATNYQQNIVLPFGRPIGWFLRNRGPAVWASAGTNLAIQYMPQ